MKRKNLLKNEKDDEVSDKIIKKYIIKLNGIKK
jgi:hypothetical protein